MDTEEYALAKLLILDHRSGCCFKLFEEQRFRVRNVLHNVSEEFTRLFAKLAVLLDASNAAGEIMDVQQEHIRDLMIKLQASAPNLEISMTNLVLNDIFTVCLRTRLLQPEK